MGGKIPGLESEGVKFQEALDGLAKDKNNPLVNLLYQVAGEKFIQDRYIGTPEQVVRTLLSEMVTGSLSHGRLPGNPSLGLLFLSDRRSAYLEQTKAGYPTSFDETGKPKTTTDALDISSRYQGGVSRNFMAWADPAVTRNLDSSNPVFPLQKIFSMGEGLLNYADANRARQNGVLIGPNEVQLTAIKTDDGDVKVYAIIPSKNGEKRVIEVPGARAIGSLNVVPYSLAGTQNTPVLRGGVVDASFIPGSRGEKTAADQTGRVLGETYAYLVRASGDLLSGKIPKLEIELPKDQETSESFRKSLETSVRSNIEKVFKRNGMDPTKVKLSFVDAAPPSRERSPTEVALAQLAQLRPADDKTISGATKSLGLDPTFFAGAGIVELKPGETITKFGESPEFVSVVIGGGIKGWTPEANGRRKFETAAKNGVTPVIGGTAFLTNWGHGGTRNATVVAGAEGAKLLIIPRSTAENKWTPENLLSRPVIKDGKVRFERGPAADPRHPGRPLHPTLLQALFSINFAR